MLRTLLAENMLGKVKWTTEIFFLSNISAVCTEMTKTYDVMIDLWQLLYMCKVEKTQLMTGMQLGVSVLNEMLQTKYKR